MEFGRRVIFVWTIIEGNLEGSLMNDYLKRNSEGRLLFLDRQFRFNLKRITIEGNFKKNYNRGNFCKDDHKG